MTRITRRSFTGILGAAGASSLLGLAASRKAAANGPSGARIIVIGGGFGGATAARYLRRYAPGLQVTLLEPKTVFHTCPFSNTVLGGLNDIDFIAHGFDGLRAEGVTVIHERAEDIDTAARTVVTDTGQRLSYDRLVVSPGVAFRDGAIEGYDEAAAEIMPHAWHGGPQTVLLRRKLEEMEDGGLFVIAPPPNPFRCPPGPYERVSLIANYFKTAKPRSKILILDAKDNFSKQGLFTAGWEELYPGMIEWVPASESGTVIAVDPATMTVETDFDRHHPAVANIIPPQKAGTIAEKAGLTDDSGWCPIKPATFESARVDGVYVVGDATIASPMPKSGYSANSQGKVVAAAIVAELSGQEPLEPSFINTCYSLLNENYGVTVAAVYGLQNGSLAVMEGSAGLSPMDAPAVIRAREADYARGWYAATARDIWG